MCSLSFLESILTSVNTHCEMYANIGPTHLNGAASAEGVWISVRQWQKVLQQICSV